MLWTGPCDRWPTEAEHAPADSHPESGACDLPPLGTEFCQQPVSLEANPSLRRAGRPIQHLEPDWAGREQRTELRPVQTSDLWNLEVINRRCFKPLSLC